MGSLEKQFLPIFSVDDRKKYEGNKNVNVGKIH